MSCFWASEFPKSSIHRDSIGKSLPAETVGGHRGGRNGVLFCYSEMIRNEKSLR